jgi:cation diffusion facilitator family transporter
MNVAVAIVTGSVIMLVEAMQGMADLTSVGLLAFGYRRSHRRANKLHPFGYGKEVYFWSIISAFIIVSITATLSFYFGYQRFLHPTGIDNIYIAYIILAVAIITNSYAFWLGAQKLLANRPFKYLVSTFINSHLIAAKTTVVLDALGTVSAVIGLSSLIAFQVRGNVYLDGIGAMLMAVVLAGFAVMLLIGALNLITGQSAPREIEQDIRDKTQGVDGVREVVGLSTMMLGSESILVNIEVHLKNDLNTDQIEEIVAEIKKRVHRIAPGMQVHVEPDAR